MNIRPETDDINWPPRDVHIGMMIQDALAHSTDAESFEKLCILIFRALFRKLKVVMKEFAENRTATDVVDKWNDGYTRNLRNTVVQESRNVFFREVYRDFDNLQKEVS
jgi:hypothetical protein